MIIAKRLHVVKKDIYFSKKEFISSESTMFSIGTNMITCILLFRMLLVRYESFRSINFEVVLHVHELGETGAS